MHPKTLLAAPFVFTLSLSFLFTVSCTKKSQQGPQGPAGEPGRDGSGYITAIEIPVPQDSWNYSTDSVEWVNELEMGQLTANVVSSAAIELFVKKDGQWWALPYVEGDKVLQFGYSINTLSLMYLGTHHTLPAKPQTTTYKLVIVSPAARMANPGVNWSDYQSVEQIIKTEMY